MRGSVERDRDVNGAEERSAAVPESPGGVSFYPSPAMGAVGQLVAAMDWSTTPLGPRSSWPRSLTNYVRMVLELRMAAILFWGPDHIQLYNDGYAVIMGPRHPKYLGATFRECWPEAYESIEPWMQRVLDRGEVVEVNRALIPLARFGFTDEAYFTFSFSPVLDDNGAVAGVLQLVTEVTDAVLGERRTRALHELSSQTSHARSIPVAVERATRVLGEHAADLPFSLLYLIDPLNRSRLTLDGTSGWSEWRTPFPSQIDLDERATASSLAAHVSRVIRDRQTVITEELAGEAGPLPGGPWPESARAAAISPIVSADHQEVTGVVICGLSPRLRPDAAYRDFIDLLCAQLGAMIGAARAFTKLEEKNRDLEEAFRNLQVAQTQLVQSTKMASLGELVAGVAHEINNPLAFAVSHVQTVSRILEQLEEQLRLGASDVERGGLHRARERLREIQTGLERISTLVIKLRTFSRLDEGELKQISVRESVESVLMILGHRLKEAEVVTRFGEPDVITCFGGPLNQAIMNLVSNAVDALEGPGRITITTGIDGSSYAITVSDTGRGIADAIRERVLEPFFSTKPVGQGTGLGLSITYSIVKKHRGELELKPRPEGGTEATIRIPRQQ